MNSHFVPSLSFSPEQLERRRQTLGASEIPVVAGLVRFKSPIALWMEKRGLAPAFDGNENTEWGTRLEGVVADKYAEVRGVEIRKSDTIVSATEPWMSATPDRLVFPSAEPDRGLEVKCRGEYLGDEWGEPGTDEVPHDVAIQCHWSMEVTGLRRWDVATLIGGNKFRMYELHYDAEIARGLVEIGREFWFDYVLPGVQPPVDGSEATARVLRTIYQHNNGALRDATVEEAQIINELREVVEERKYIEGREQEIKNRLMEAIGESDGIVAPDGSKVTWKAPSRGAVSYKAALEILAERFSIPSNEVEIAIERATGAPSRRFLPTFPKSKR